MSWLDEQYWNLIVNNDQSVQQLSSDQQQIYKAYRYWFRTTHIEASYQVNKPLLIVQTINADANFQEKFHYKFGGNAIMYVPDNFQENSIYPSVQIKEVPLRINQRTLVPFPDSQIYPYQLTVRLPYWIKNILLRVWEFTGSNDLLPDTVWEDINSQAKTVASDLEGEVTTIDNLDAKIDAVRSNVDSINQAIQNMNNPNAPQPTKRVINIPLI
jgi:hypothetical protein